MTVVNLGAGSGIAAQGIVENFRAGTDRADELAKRTRQEAIDKENLRGAGIRNTNAEALGIREEDLHGLRKKQLEQSNENLGITGEQLGVNLESSQIELDADQEQAEFDKRNKVARDEAAQQELAAKTAQSNAEALEAKLNQSENAVKLALAEDAEGDIDQKVLMQQAERVYGSVLDLRDLYKQSPERALNYARRSPLLGDVADQLADIVVDDEGNVSFVDAAGNVLVDEDGFDDDGESEALTFKVDDIPPDLHKKLRPEEHAAKVEQQTQADKRAYELYRTSLGSDEKGKLTDYQRFKMINENHLKVGNAVEQTLASMYRLEPYTDGSYGFTPAQAQEALDIAKRIAPLASKQGAPSVHELVAQYAFHPELTEKAMNTMNMTRNEIEDLVSQFLEAQLKNTKRDANATRRSILQGLIDNPTK